MRILIAIIMTLGLQACSKSLYEEGTLTPSRVQVQEEKFYQHIPLAQVSDAYLEGLAHHHDKYGDEAININVVYDPAKQGALKASGTAAEIAGTLRAYGVRNVQSDILPVRGEDSLIVTYAYYTAHAPKDCTTMPGFSGTNIGGQRDYRAGCTIETLIARQIARPKDLLGQKYSDPTTDGRSAANLVNAVRTGTLNSPLGGEQASSN